MRKEDLRTEPALAGAPRDDDGHPTLGGIPVLRKLGRGGMATVYYGIHPRLRFEVAIKVLDAELARDGQVVHRFFHEAQVAIQINSAHLVRVLDVNEEKGIYFLVQEFVGGPTAWRMMKELTGQGFVGLAERDALDIVRATAAGLVEVHRRGIVHRDVKPDNILIPKRFGSNEPEPHAAKLADLGLARMVAPVVGISGEANLSVGTPGFVAPEQALDAQTALPAADVFGLGATLFSLLCGQAPFTGKDPMDVLLKTARADHPPVEQFRDDLHDQTLDVLERCLEHDPQDRYPDAMDLVKALNKIEIEHKRPPRHIGADLGATAIMPAQQQSSRSDSSGALPSTHKTPHTNPQYASTRYAVQSNLNGHTGWVRCVAFSPDGRRVATASDDKSICIWEVNSGELVRRFAGHERLHAGPILSVQYSPDGRLLISASQDYHARVWDPQSGKVLVSMKHKTWVNYAEFSPNGTQAITCGIDTRAYLWDIETGQQLRVFGGHSSNVQMARFHPNGDQLVTVSHDRTACLWDLAEMTLKRRLRGHTRPVTAAAYSPDGKRLATTGDDGTIQIWDARIGSRQRRIEAHAFPINHLDWNADGTMVITASEDHTARIWDANSPHVRYLLNAHTQPLRWAVFSPVDHRVATASEDYTARIWSPAIG